MTIIYGGNELTLKAPTPCERHNVKEIQNGKIVWAGFVCGLSQCEALQYVINPNN